MFLSPYIPWIFSNKSFYNIFKINKINQWCHRFLMNIMRCKWAKKISISNIYTSFANSVDPDQLASEEANWSGSALFAIKYVNL